MNKLEQQYYDKFSFEFDWVEERHLQFMARIAASIALELADKAFVAGRSKSSFDQFEEEMICSEARA
jgi:hypothetical protein